MTVIDLAAIGPPEGEKGTSDPSSSTYWPGANVFGAYDQWTGGLCVEPTAQDYSRMLDRDGKAEALANVLTLPLRWADMQIEPAEGDTGEAELVSGALLTPPHEGGMSTPLDHVIAQMTSAVWQRVSFHEIVWESRPGQVIVKKLPLRPPQSCRIKRDKHNGDFLGFQQRVPFDPGADSEGWVLIERDKALVWIHDQARDPLNGRSALRTAHTAFEAKQKVRYLWFAFLQRFATPWATTTDSTQDDTTARNLARKAAGLMGGGVLGLREGQSLQLHEPTADGGAFLKCMDYLSDEMGQSVLAGFLGLTQQSGGGKGSYALSKDSSDFFLRACEARSSELGGVLTNYLAADIVRWNRGPAGRTPTIRFAKLSDQRAEQATALFEAMLSQSVPDPRIPPEFMDLLTERVAETLGPKAADIIHRAIEDRKAQTPLARLNDVAGRAAQLVQDAGLT